MVMPNWLTLTVGEEANHNLYISRKERMVGDTEYYTARCARLLDLLQWASPYTHDCTSLSAEIHLHLFATYAGKTTQWSSCL